VPVAAVADTVVVSAALANTAANVLDDPVNVCVFVNEFAAVVTGILAADNVVCPVPPFAIGNVPVIPVDNGNPVQFVNVPEEGVCKTKASAVCSSCNVVPVSTNG